MASYRFLDRRLRIDRQKRELQNFRNIERRARNPSTLRRPDNRYNANSRRVLVVFASNLPTNTRPTFYLDLRVTLGETDYARNPRSRKSLFV